MTALYKTIHTVSSGESFWSISQLYEIEGNKLLEFNKDKGITNTLAAFSQRTPKWGVQPGDRVYIPINNEENKIVESPQDHKKFLPEPDNEKLKKNSPNIGATSKCKQCNFYELSVQCSNKKRGYVHKADNSMGPVQVFQVIAGGEQHDPNNNFDTITVKFDADSCKQGKPKTVCSVVQIDDGTVISSGQDFEAHAPKSLLSNDDFTTFIKEFLIPNSHSKRYELTAKSCNSNDYPNISIESFSSVKWEGSITLGYFHEAYENSDKYIKKKGYWSIEGGISIENGADKVSIGSPKGVQKSSTNNDLTKKVFKNAQDFLNKTTPLLSNIKSDYAKVEINWPLLNLKGGVSNTEIYNSPNVGLEGNISIGFKPLIGAKFTVDILNILIAAAGAASAAVGGPVFAKFLIKLKAQAAKGNKYGKVGIEILFSISGNISGELNWDCKPLNNTVKGGVEGAVPIVIEGKAEIEIDIFWVSIAAGAKAGAKTGFAAELKPGWDSNNGAFLGGCVKFDGITLYYVLYSRVGGGDVKEGSKAFASRPKSKEAKSEYENSEKFEWIKASKWPDGDSENKIALSKGGI